MGTKEGGDGSEGYCECRLHDEDYVAASGISMKRAREVEGFDSSLMKGDGLVRPYQQTSDRLLMDVRRCKGVIQEILR